MRKILTLFVLLLSLVVTVPAQEANNGAIVNNVEQASQAFRQQVDSGRASADWTGLGLVSGDMVDLDLSNEGDAPQSFRFVPGMVLEDPGKQVQPILLDENLNFTLEPGESVKRRMRGYCLDYTKSPPASQSKEDYVMAVNLDAYENAIAVLYSGLRLERSQRLKPVLRPLVHRTVTTQRAVWAVMGGENPDSREDLREEIEAELRANSSLFPEGQLECLSQRLWSDVQNIMMEAKANE